MFFFFFENVATRHKEGNEEAIELLSYLDGKAFEFSYATFIDDGVLNDNANDFEKVRKALIAEFKRYIRNRKGPSKER